MFLHSADEKVKTSVFGASLQTSSLQVFDWTCFHICHLSLTLRYRSDDGFLGIWSWNACLCNSFVTWNSGNYGSGRTPACRHVPGPVWNEYPALPCTKGPTAAAKHIFISPIYVPMPPRSTAWEMTGEGATIGGGESLMVVSKPPHDLITRRLWCSSLSFSLSFFELFSPLFLISRWTSHVADRTLFPSEGRPHVALCTILVGWLNSEQVPINPLGPALRKHRSQ